MKRIKRTFVITLIAAIIGIGYSVYYTNKIKEKEDQQAMILFRYPPIDSLFNAGSYTHFLFVKSNHIQNNIFSKNKYPQDSTLLMVCTDSLNIAKQINNRVYVRREVFPVTESDSSTCALFRIRSINSNKINTYTLLQEAL